MNIVVDEIKKKIVLKKDKKEKNYISKSNAKKNLSRNGK
jgi:hypothetical protein